MEESKSRKIYVVGGATNYANWMQGVLVDKLEDADLVVFTGGEDVDPSLYNESKNSKTYSNINRDRFEQTEFNEAKKLDKKMIGICRGSQFLCVMAGGSLIQHQENPGFVHSMHTCDLQFPFIEVTSTHHQAQNPSNLNVAKYRLLGWTIDQCGKRENGYGQHVYSLRENEIVYYPEIKGLAIQCHPEMMYGELRFQRSMKYLTKLLDKLMQDTL